MSSCETLPTEHETVAPETSPARSSLASQFLRYLVVGGFAFLVDFGTLALLTSVFGWHYLQSAAVALTLGTLINYALSVRWVFDVRAVKNHRLEFAVFALVGVCGLVINHFVLWALTDGLDRHYLESKLVATGVVLLWNFGARKRLLFTADSAAR
jgi:putative flippase GtrA